VKSEQNQTAWTIFAVLSATIFFFAIHARLGTALSDDAAFFLRYAENMVHGNFWVWNRGEAPVWGASAPLFPLLLALPIALGAPMVPAIIWVSVGLSTLALSAVSVLLGKRFGLIAGIAFVVLASLDTELTFFAGSGLETPLTLALLTFALYVLLEQKGEIAAGVAIGLLAVNKLDLVPVAGLLFIAYGLMVRRLPVKALLVSAAITLAWYGFAWVYFGFPVPNSFLTKAILQDVIPKTIDWHWFSNTVFLKFGHWIFGLLAIASLWRCGKNQRYLLLFTLGLLATHTIAYTLKFPFEPYDWYCMPALFTLIVLASIGVTQIAHFAKSIAKGTYRIDYAISIALLALIVWTQMGTQVLDAHAHKFWLATAEQDRADAGGWVNAHTPKTFRVATWFGNPALFSERYVFDLSHLNRRAVKEDILSTYKPEILILQNNPWATPMTPDSFGPNYQAVKVFDRTFAQGEGNMFFTVYARTNVIKQMTDVSFPVTTSCRTLDDCQRYQPVTLKKPTTTVPSTLATFQVNAQYCSIDGVNGATSNGPHHLPKDNTLALDGWAVATPHRENTKDTALSLPDAIFIKIAGQGHVYYTQARSHLGRADVVTGMKFPSELSNSGFDAKADLSDLPTGDYQVNVLLSRPQQTDVCRTVAISIGQ